MTNNSYCTIGILALQGAFVEHEIKFKECNNHNSNNKYRMNVIAVKSNEELQSVDGLVIPGGESTAIRKIAKRLGLWDALLEIVAKGRIPIWGTCAGMILLSKEILPETTTKDGTSFTNNDNSTLNAIDLIVKRNSFGRQNDSFDSPLIIHKTHTKDFPSCSTPSPGALFSFIRAPSFHCINNDKVTVIASIMKENQIIPVAIQQGLFIATSFHPELNEKCLEWHQYFINVVLSSNPKQIN